LTYGATPLKDRGTLQPAIQPLVDGGYTVFVINYRSASRFRYPAPVEDAQRAVRYVRHHAAEFGIHPDYIGAAGHSSGASLALLLGVLDGNGTPEDTDGVERASAKVQAVVSLAAPTDFINLPVSYVQSSYLGVVLMDPKAVSSPEYKIYRAASAVFHATNDDPPTLLMHGDADPIVPFPNVELMNKALSDAGVTVSEIVIKGGGHFPPYPPTEPDPFRQTVKWFDKYLVSRLQTH
jgi:acetyl esterase/lipase